MSGERELLTTTTATAHEKCEDDRREYSSRWFGDESTCHAEPPTGCFSCRCRTESRRGTQVTRDTAPCTAANYTVRAGVIHQVEVGLIPFHNVATLPSCTIWTQESHIGDNVRFGVGRTLCKYCIEDWIANKIDSIWDAIAAGRIVKIDAANWIKVGRLVPLIDARQEIPRQAIAVKIVCVIPSITRSPKLQIGVRVVADLPWLKSEFVRWRAICDRHRIQPTQFYLWQRQLFENGAAAFERTTKRPGPSLQDRKLQQLVTKNEVIAELLEENVHLKKLDGAL